MVGKLLYFILVIVGIYIIVCVAFYYFQEKLIFFPETLEKNHQFDFGQKFEERNFETADGKLLNGLLFKADSTKGLIFYLHGNAGSINGWGYVAEAYTELDYDVFILDYRGYGKSEGKITSQKQLFDDNQMVYDNLKKEYNEQDIIILGYSIGTGMASYLASENTPKRLILQAPYYSLTDLAGQLFPFLPTFILRYKFANNEYLENCTVTIFHGNQDEVIPYESSLRLKEEFKSKIHLIILDGVGHNGMTESKEYKRELKSILSE
ncbi:alpha/beta hydrolase [Aquiflexum sp.]|uniref:alpha/beta hydrolase n=1 Tax=Aquiflexum sp. TaxID=1872584 RepID=UPI00359433A2